MQLEIDHWMIRSWRHEDVASLVKYANNRKISINLRDSFPFPYPVGDAEDWVRCATEHDPETNFAIAGRKEAIGGIGLRLGSDVFRRTAEIGYWLGEPHWGKGIATKAVEAFTEFAFSNFEIERVQAIVYEWNTASARVLEKAGYALEGRLRKSVTKDGMTIDQFVYARVLE
jgi:RimJ/RimL family protein N-acetyltransferase